MSYKNTIINFIIFLSNSHFSYDQAALILGILWGIKSTLSQQFRNNLVNSSLIHIVVVSGYNINLIFSSTFSLFKKTGRNLSFVISFAVLLIYVLIVGGSPPVIRAFIMNLLVRFATLLGRPSAGLPTLVITMLIMIAFNSHLINDISFQFSFMATLGLVIFNDRIFEIFKSLKLTTIIPDFILKPLSETLSSNLMLMPLISFHFGRISLVAPVSNVLASFLITPLTYAGILFFASSIIDQDLTLVISYLLKIPLDILVTIVNFFGSLPISNYAFQFSTTDLFIYYLFLLFLLV